jgi:Zn-dependent M28 family amino/carboxypeptidase
MIRALAILAGLAAIAGAPAPGAKLMPDVRVLSADNMEGRGAGSPGGARARQYLVGRMREIGLKPVWPDYQQPFSAGKVQGVNLVGVVAGTSASDKVMVVSAHYDHLGVRNGQVFNGADDNASGVAALLAAAEDLKRRPPRHTVIFALWDAEEVGSPGAKAFLRAPPIPLARIALNVNFDMLSRGDKNELYVAGAQHYPFLRPRLEMLAKRAPVPLKLGHDGPPWTGSDDWTGGSDHREFHKVGIPFAYFGVEDHSDYHKPTDDFAKVPQSFFRRSAATVLAAVRMFDADLDAIARESGR